MMNTLNDVHRMFAEYFPEKKIQAHAWLLSKRLAEGHVCIGIREAEELKGEIPYQVHPIMELSALTGLVGRPGDVKPFIIDGDRMYLQRYHRYESRIAEHIRRMTENGRTKAAERMQLLESQADLIRSLEADYPLEGLTPEQQIDWQLIAALNALTDDFSIITGGPGTGKTTTLAKLLRILYACQPDDARHCHGAARGPSGRHRLRHPELC